MTWLGSATKWRLVDRWTTRRQSVSVSVSVWVSVHCCLNRAAACPCSTIPGPSFQAAMELFHQRPVSGSYLQRGVLGSDGNSAQAKIEPALVK